MEKQTQELAKMYMAKMETIVNSTDRFPVKFEDRQQTTAKLLGWYGAMIKSRGVQFQMDEATISKVERVIKWMFESQKRGLLLCGTLGNGKTTMLRALKCMFGSHVVYYEAQEIYEHYKQNQSLPQVSGHSVLLIDDLGVEPASYNEFGEIRYPLAEMLMTRYKYNTTTIIATNYTPEQLGETYGPRVADRMREMYAMIRYIEPSYRK